MIRNNHHAPKDFLAPFRQAAILHSRQAALGMRKGESNGKAHHDHD